MQNCLNKFSKTGEEDMPNQDEQGQDENQENQSQDPKNQDGDFQSQITQVITDLAKQINNLKYELSNMKKVVMTKSVLESPDLNKTVLSNNDMIKKQAFLQVMDELNDVADAFINTQPHISKRIDNIMDSLRLYDKQGLC
jgi:enamine deaminase RidA (YjgF/YER057c/UK114 family)